MHAWITLSRWPADGLISGTVSFHEDLHLLSYTTLSGSVVTAKLTQSGNIKKKLVFQADHPIFGSPCWCRDCLAFCTLEGHVHMLDASGAQIPPPITHD